ncbi:class II aldolase/adducin family protein [soil metagenome]
MSALPQAREALVDAARQLDAAGLNHNASGNLSIRVGTSVLVTPTGMPAAGMTPKDAVLLDLDGQQIGGFRRPTSEWQLHTEIMRRRPDVSAIVHTHSPEATAAAIIGRTVPTIHYVAARFGIGPDEPGLRCADYATYGTEQLAANVADTLGEAGRACLMANHGAVVLADDLDAGVALAIDVEWFCGVHRRALQLGEPVSLVVEEIARVADRFRSYGQPAD